MRAAVLGSPIAHSLSPALHRAAYRALGLDWTYDAFEVSIEQLPDVIRGLDDDWAGLSLTMPLKEAVIPLLVDVDETARQVAAVNTVLPAEGGWRGTNTDIEGIVRSIRAFTERAHRATLLGAGATARSALAAMAELGVVDVVIAARRPDAAEPLVVLAAHFGMHAQVSGFEPHVELMARELVVSTLPGDAGRPWATVCTQADGVLLDASYHPWPTPLAAAWPNASVASGRDMLLWQAAAQVRLMTGRDAPVDAMAAGLADAEATRAGG